MFILKHYQELQELENWLTPLHIIKQKFSNYSSKALINSSLTASPQPSPKGEGEETGGNGGGVTPEPEPAGSDNGNGDDEGPNL